MIENLKLAAPCGLYCRICSTFLEEICHGCGCEVGDCKNTRREIQPSLMSGYRFTRHAREKIL